MRSSIADSRLSPVENLATNPSFERVVPGSTIVRRNLCPNPFFAETSNGWGGVNRGTITRSAAAAISGSYGGRISVPADATAGDAGITMPSFPVVAGVSYTLSFTIRAVTAGRWNGYTSAAFTNTNDRWDTGVMQPGETRRVVIRRRATVTGSSGTSYILRHSSQIGALVEADIDLVLYEDRPEALPFFWGGQANDRGIAYAWEGTANASPSVARAAVVEVWRNFFNNPGARSTQNLGYWPGNGTARLDAVASAWSRSGSAVRSLRVAGNNSSETAGPQVTGLGLVAGQVYTAEWDLVPSKNTTVSGIYLGGAAADGYTITASSGVQAVTANQPSHQWVTFTAGTGANGRVFAYINGQVEGDWFEVSNLAIYAGPRNPTLAYFDGAATPDADLAPAWTGAENASPSVLYGLRADGWAANPPAGTWLTLASPFASSPTAVVIGNKAGYAAEGYCEIGLDLNRVRGKTITLLARFRSVGTLSRPAVGAARAILARCYGSTVQPSALSPWVDGDTGVARLVVTVPADTTAFAFRLNGLSNLDTNPDGRVWWDRAMAVEGVYTGPYIDGDMPGVIWRGTPHGSTSVGYPRLA